ncbi:MULTISPECIES: RnfH family protein [unclassified Luteimonas]
MQLIRAWPERFESEELELGEGATVADALALTRLPRDGVAGFAVHGERVEQDAPLHEGDRLELLGPLLADPKDSRRRRARVQADRAGRR